MSEPGIEEEETPPPVVSNDAATDIKEKIETAENGTNEEEEEGHAVGNDAKMAQVEDLNTAGNADEEEEEANKLDNEDVQMVDAEDGGEKVKLREKEDVEMGEAEGGDGKMGGDGSVADEDNNKGQGSKENEKEAVKQEEAKEEKVSKEIPDESKEMPDENKEEEKVVNRHKEEKVSKEMPDESKEEEKVVNKQKENKGDGRNAAQKQQEEKGQVKNGPEKHLEVGAKLDAKKKVAEEEKGAGENQEDQTEGAEKKDDGEVGKVHENKDVTPKNKKARSVREKGHRNDKKQDGSNSKEEKELWSSPSPYALDRPVRERKTVERLVEVIDKEPNRNFVVEKGRGTPLKDIPNVAHKLARKKPGDLKLLHQILFGRRGKAIDFKSHILQFSGFVWHESDEKQRAKTKEKLDKFVKDTLLGLCDLFDIPVVKANTRKEDLVVKLLDFIAEPHAIAESVLSEEQISKYRKRKRGAKGSATLSKRSRKEYDDEDTPTTKGKRAQDDDTDDDYDEDEDDDEANKEPENEDQEDEEADEGDEYEYALGKEKSSGKKSSKGRGSSGRKSSITGSSSKKSPFSTVGKSPNKTPSSKHTNERGSPDEGAQVFSRKKKSISTPKRTPSSEKETKDKKSSGKKMAKGKGKAAETEKSGPSKEELRKTITMIIKKVDFNTATFSDILKKLDEHYKMDMTPRKAAIKVLIQEELTKLAREDEDEDEDEEHGEKENNLEQDKEIEV